MIILTFETNVREIPTHTPHMFQTCGATLGFKILLVKTCLKQLLTRRCIPNSKNNFLNSFNIFILKNYNIYL